MQQYFTDFIFIRKVLKIIKLFVLHLVHIKKYMQFQKYIFTAKKKKQRTKIAKAVLLNPRMSNKVKDVHLLFSR